jgi:putative transposase
VGADNPVIAADLVSCAGWGMVRLGIWLRVGPAIRHRQYSCQYDWPTWRCCVCSAGSPCCPALTVGAVFPGRLYVLFFVEHGTRRVHVAGITAHPAGEWVARQARNLSMNLDDQAGGLKFLIRDRDAKFTVAFDAVFAAVGMRIIKAQVRAPRANAVAERWISGARRECLNRMLITGERHLRLVLGEYADHCNVHCPHRTLCQSPPAGRVRPPAIDLNVRVLRRDRLRGLIHEYAQVA